MNDSADPEAEKEIRPWWLQPAGEELAEMIGMHLPNPEPPAWWYDAIEREPEGGDAIDT